MFSCPVCDSQAARILETKDGVIELAVHFGYTHPKFSGALPCNVTKLSTKSSAMICKWLK